LGMRRYLQSIPPAHTATNTAKIQGLCWIMPAGLRTSDLARKDS
jgi:hypothetical protein